MVLIQARFFLQSDGHEPSNCQVDNITRVIAEAIIQSEYGSTHEEVNMLEMRIVQAGTNNCVKRFIWNGSCALAAGSTYTIDTPNFLLPVGSYQIQMGDTGSPLSRSLPECGINMSEVSC